MNARTLLLALAFAAGFASASLAQQSHGQMPMGGSHGGQAMPAPSNLPEACRTAAQAGGHGQMMQGQGQMPHKACRA